MRLQSLWRSGDEPPVTTMELFFDLVYVFAVTQLSATLLHHLTVRGGVETLVLFGAVWWVWNYTAWATNWVDPDRVPVRVLLAVLMLLSLIMSAAIPEAFGDHGLQFAVAVAAMQVLRPLFMVIVLRGHQLSRNYLHLGIWSTAASVLWIVGATADGNARLLWWVAALAVDVLGPAANYAVPGLGRTPMSTWTLSPAHLAERCRLIVIIALGESVLSIGKTYAELSSGARASASLIVAFVETFALWWLYFTRRSDGAVHRVIRSGDPAKLGRGAYAYAHALLVAGIIVTAVAAEQTMSHPDHHAEWPDVLVIVGGPAVFAVGMLVFLISTGGFDRTERLAGATGFAALLALAVAGGMAGWPLLLLDGAVAAVLLALAVVTSLPTAQAPNTAPELETR
ncbi:low temperature requirement protein A [Nocardia mexicana]|uniref:Low temperature requirement protein LtrA n=1 Tax=Nocardia mexicana TaxID=279262 RepID=A0A370HFA9_9NOCA|nr:low temperature requirement protein A [Nocardia mexicana]RDI55928.1 low temperature requirement protein LtrA [Nocardia mexicana]